MDNTTGFANRTSLSDAKFKEKIGLAFLYYVKSDTVTNRIAVRAVPDQPYPVIKSLIWNFYPD
jgi:hypothetical protein